MCARNESLLSHNKYICLKVKSAYVKYFKRYAAWAERSAAKPFKAVLYCALSGIAHNSSIYAAGQFAFWGDFVLIAA